MIDITAWMQNFLQKLNDTFGNRVWFVGLQGSYGRGEARDTSKVKLAEMIAEMKAEIAEEKAKLKEGAD
jgi:hypothetical protein